MKNLLLIAIIIISTLTSCDIQKKRYSRGFTISKNRNYGSSVKKNKDVKSNQNSEVSKISPPSISKVKHTLLITNIVNGYKIELASENVEKLEIVNTDVLEIKDKKSSKLTPNTNSNEFDNYNIKSKKSKKTYTPDTQKKPVNKSSILALIFFLVPFIGFLLAFIFAFKALKEIKESPNKYRKSSKTLAIIATIPFYIMLLSLLIISLVLAVSYGLIFVLITLGLLLIAVLPIINLYFLKSAVKNKPPAPNREEKKPTIKKKKPKKSISKSNKLLIFFIVLFSSILLIPLAFNK